MGGNGPDLKIMRTLLLFSSLVAVTIAKNSICSGKLCSILARDINSHEFKYLNFISKEIRAQSPLLFDPLLVDEVLSTFASKYNLEVEVIDASGSKEIFFPNQSTPEMDNPPKSSPSTNLAQTYLNVLGFKTFNGFAYYSFHVYSQYAEYLLVTLKQPLMTI